MRNIFKRLSCLILAVAFVFCFAACGGNDSTGNNGSANDPKLEKFVESQGATFEKSFEDSFKSSSGGLNCDCKLSVDGTKLIVDCLVEGIDDVPSETKDEMQKAYEATKDQLSEAFKPIKDEVSNLSEVTLNICESDGDVIATINMPF